MIIKKKKKNCGWNKCMTPYNATISNTDGRKYSFFIVYVTFHIMSCTCESVIFLYVSSTFAINRWFQSYFTCITNVLKNENKWQQILWKPIQQHVTFHIYSRMKEYNTEKNTIWQKIWKVEQNLQSFHLYD